MGVTTRDEGSAGAAPGGGGLGAVLRAHRDRILATWEALALADTPGGAASALALRDHLPAFLDELVGWVEGGAPPAQARVGAASLQQVLHRLDQGLDLAQVLREYRQAREALLRTVLEVDAADAGRRSPAEERARVEEVARLNAGLDVALSEAITWLLGERDRRATRLSRYEQRYTELFESSPEAILVHQEGRVVMANGAAAALFGARSPSELVGRAALDLFHPECHDLIRRRHAGVQAGQRQPLVEERIVRLDGEVRDVEVVTATFPYERGVGVQAVLRDVTDRRRAQEALRHTAERLRRMIDANPVGVVEGDASGRILDANDAYLRLVGCTRHDLLSGAVRWDELTPPEHLPADLRAIGEARERGVSDIYEKEYLRPDGRRVPVLVACASFGPRGELVAFVVDISDRKRAEEALREIDRRKTEFLALLSHELRNPLAAIRNALAVLDTALPGSPASGRARGVLHRQAEQLGRLVDDLLDLSRIAHGKIEVRLARLDAREVARRVQADARALFEQREVRLALAEPAEPLWVDADAVRLSQMLGNLLHNALKFTPPHGEVELQLARRGERVELAVQDTGAGLDPAELERIFAPFVQAERTPPGQGGLGLGLALVRELATKHGGDVRAESAGPGRGARFAVRLPARPPPPRPVAAPPAVRRAEGLSVLIVEDNEDSAATLADLLALGGNRVRTAATGDAAVNAVAAAPPDVLICDIGLPDMSGHDVIRAIRAREGRERLFAMALSGYAQARDREQALAAGFDAHLPKPPPLEELHALLAEAARRRGAGPPADGRADPADAASP